MEGRCEHGAAVRVSDKRDPSLATVNVYTCRRACCMHEAFHVVDDVAKGATPIIVPLPPV